jgi:hypothetical protein
VGVWVLRVFVCCVLFVYIYIKRDIDRQREGRGGGKRAVALECVLYATVLP